MQVLLAHALDQGIIEAFERNRLVGHNLWDVIRGNVGIGETKHQQRASRRTVDEAHGGFQHGDTRTFATNQRPRNVKAVFWQQLVEVVAGNTAVYLGKRARTRSA